MENGADKTVAHQRPKEQALVEVKKLKFLEAYAVTGVIGPAVKAADISRSTYYNWIRDDEAFDLAVKMAFEDAVDIAESAVVNRGVEGIEEPVFYKGEPIWKRDPETGSILTDDDFNPIPFTVNKTSDRLLEFYLAANRKKYNAKQALEITGPGDHTDGDPDNLTVTIIRVQKGHDNLPDIPMAAQEGDNAPVAKTAENLEDDWLN